jgi:hypothetical protein
MGRSLVREARTFAAQDIGVVHQQHTVRDHDAEHHDDAHHGGRGEGRVGKKQDENHARESHGDGKHDDERIHQGLKLRRHDHIHQREGQDRRKLEALKRFALLLDLPRQPDGEPGGQL